MLPRFIFHSFSNEGSCRCAKCRQFKRSQIFVPSSPSFGRGFDSHRPLRTIDSIWVAGFIYTVAGTPKTPGYRAADEGAVATAAELNQPWSIFVDGFGNLFIADSNNHIVREVPGLTSSTMAAGNIYTVAGTPGQFGFSNDGTAATSALLNFPIGVTVDPAGNLFISDGGDQRAQRLASKPYLHRGPHRCGVAETDRGADQETTTEHIICVAFSFLPRTHILCAAPGVSLWLKPMLFSTSAKVAGVTEWQTLRT
jgi:hypothetical protein